MAFIKRFFIYSIGIFLVSSFLNSYQGGRDELSLRIFPQSLRFAAAEPDQEPVIAANSLINIEISVKTDRRWNLTLLADGDLKGPRGARIAIQNVTWTATPSPPFISGTLSRNQPQILAQGEGRDDIRGELSFFLKNSWDYEVGEYSQTLTFTISAL
jgi:hypothetical protein